MGGSGGAGRTVVWTIGVILLVMAIVALIIWTALTGSSLPEVGRALLQERAHAFCASGLWLDPVIASTARR